MFYCVGGQTKNHNQVYLNKISDFALNFAGNRNVDSKSDKVARSHNVPVLLERHGGKTRDSGHIVHKQQNYIVVLCLWIVDSILFLKCEDDRNNALSHKHGRKQELCPRLLTKVTQRPKQVYKERAFTSHKEYKFVRLFQAEVNNQLDYQVNCKNQLSSFEK